MYKTKVPLPANNIGKIIPKRFTRIVINLYDDLDVTDDCAMTLCNDDISNFPDFFEQVNDEEDEKDQEAIKRLESRGWRVEKLLNRFWVCPDCGTRSKKGELSIHICDPYAKH